MQMVCKIKQKPLGGFLHFVGFINTTVQKIIFFHSFERQYDTLF